MTDISFVKMHGLGNDFIVIDRRTQRLFEVEQVNIPLLCNRHFGIGCDQLVVLEPSKKADLFMRIYNSDGGMVETCGNALRCVADLAQREGNTNVSIETAAGIVAARGRSDGLFEINMGKPRLGWQEIPLAREQDTLKLDIALDENIREPVAVSMGNPHAVFFVRHAEEINLEHLGPMLEHHALFPQRANISFASMTDAGNILLRVWERGAGATMACGTAACATAVAAVRKGIKEREQEICLLLPGGMLYVTWLKSGFVLMTGPSQLVYRGSFRLEDFRR